jgi:lauroyl/myristoyl acyltransferase
VFLKNGFQRRAPSLPRLKQLKSERRYAVLSCFLHQLYADTIDFLIEMHDKLMTGVYTRAENNIAKEMIRRRRAINRSFAIFRTL